VSAPNAAAVSPLRRGILDLGAAALLLGVSVAGFWPTFGGPSYLVAAIGGVVLGLAIAVVGMRLRWGILLVSALTVVAYFLFGGALALPHTAVAGVIPTLETLRQLAVGVITSWKALLTTVAPVDVADGNLIVPFLLGLVAAVLTGSLALRLRVAAWAVLPAAVFLAVQIALGTSEPAVPLVQGGVFAVVAIAWLAIRQAWSTPQSAISLGGEETAGRGMATRRLVAGGIIVAVAATAGVAASAFAAPTGPRYVLRDVVIPPFDIRQYPSPMQSYRAYVRDDKEKPLFTVTGLPDGARVRLATMDAYNGTVYNVSDSGAGSSSAFTPVRGKMSPDAQGQPATVRVEIGDYSGVWMPDAGAVTDVTFDGDRAEELRRSAHYNEATETGVVTARLQAGDGYTMSSVIPAVPSDESLADVPFAPLSMPKQTGVPDDLAALASDTVADATTPIEQARALQQFLSQGGFFSHGLEGEVLSRAGHGAERILTLLGGDQMVGDDEQYATAMALLAREIGMPARVVMGFYPGEDEQGPVFTATGDNLHAWVEIAFDGAGWVPFDPTPPEDQVPTDQNTKPKTEPKPQVLQPPPPEQEPADLPPTVADDRESDEESPIDLGLLFAIIGWTALGLGILALLAAPFVVIGAIKLARRRRRLAAKRESDRISGGWDELRDQSMDYGAPVRTGATHLEDATVISAAFAEPRVATLARAADAQVFGPADPSADDVKEFWRQVDEIVGGMRKGTPFWGRVKARLSLKSLLAGTRVASLLRPAASPGPRSKRSAHSSPDASTSTPAPEENHD
jgi:hypothetical protein